ncbi:MAG: GntR family transcriptional regulator [Muribaculaceae bacterium]|nr:GntR family transcriptional regulator [Muribaculaceae bacterium]
MEYNNKQTIYQQITDYCLRRISSGEWNPGERIPSTRELSLRLGVNSRTIIRAYEELEQMGIIYTQRGFGSFTHADVLSRLAVIRRQEFAATGLWEFIRMAREAGFSLPEVIAEIEKQWNNGSDILSSD